MNSSKVVEDSGEISIITNSIISDYRQNIFGGVELSLYEYGYFNIKELAEVIKLLYSFKRQQDNKILTFANLNLDHIGPKEDDLEYNVYLRFLVGNDKTLDSFYQYDKCFFEEYQKLHETMCEYSQIKFSGISNLIVLSPNLSFDQNSLSISCDGFGYYGQKLTGDGINYSDEWQKHDACAMFSDRYNIFSVYPLTGLIKHICSSSIVVEILNFPISLYDNFIAEILMSIVIYKRYIGKVDLDNEDYRYIFYKLFGEDVDIVKEMEKDFPGKLRYVRKREVS